jgi:transcriptional regulator with XRE-family HTH domain
MTAQELKSARLAKGWTEAQAARRLKVSQGYLNYLEHGKRTLTPGLLQKATAVYGLSPETVPLPVTFTPRPAPHEELFESLAKLGYLVSPISAVRRRPRTHVKFCSRH